MARNACISRPSMRKPPPPKPAGALSRPVSKDESALWRHVMDEVEPLAEDNIAPEPESEPALRPPGAAAKKSEPSARPRRPMPAPAPPAPSREPELRHGEAPGLEKRTKNRMRRRKVDIEATLDLHGHAVDQARSSVRDFLATHSRTSAGSVVHIITGKSTGVLLGIVREMLDGEVDHQVVNTAGMMGRGGGVVGVK